MILFQPAWMTDDPRKEAQALNKIRNEIRQDRIERAALNAPLASVRVEAVDKLKNQEALYKAATGDSDKKVRERAVMGITDQEKLLKIAMSDDPTLPRGLAANRITDQATLERIALFDEHPGQIAAIRKVESQAVLGRLVLSNSVYVRQAAVSVIKDEEVLKEIACNDPERSIRLEAAQRIGLTDVINECRLQSRIENLINAPKYTLSRDAKAEIGTISDKSALAKIYSYAENPSIRRLALERMISITPGPGDLADFLLKNKLDISDADKVVEAIRSPHVCLYIMKRVDRRSSLGKRIAEKALEKLVAYPDMLYTVYESFKDDKALSERAWELLVLRYKTFLEEKGLKKEADEAEKTIKAKYEAARKHLDEVMDHIPD